MASLCARSASIIARRAAPVRHRSLHRIATCPSTNLLRAQFSEFAASYRRLEPVSPPIRLTSPAAETVHTAETAHTVETAHPSVSSMYHIGEELGEGAFGTVYAGQCRRTGDRVAVKSMPKSLNPFGVREIEMMRRVVHRNVAELLDSFEDDEAYHVVMPRYQGSDLFDLVDKCGVVGEEKALGMVQEMLSALEAVHRAGMAHLDVKPENFIHTECGRIVLIDFGSAEPFLFKPYAERQGDYLPGCDDTLSSLDRLVGSADYLPPEVADNAHSRFSSRSDVWGVGLVFFVLLEGRLPYNLQSALPVFEDLKNSIDSMSNISMQGRSILKSMLHLDPAQRPSPTDAKEMINRLPCNRQMSTSMSDAV